MEIDLELGKNHQKLPPAIRIPLTDVAPGSLHTFLGIVPKLWEEIEKLADKVNPTIKSELLVILAHHRIDKSAWFQKFTGKLRTKK